MARRRAVKPVEPVQAVTPVQEILPPEVDFDSFFDLIRKLPPRQREVFDRVCIGQDEGNPPRSLQALERKGLIESREERIPFGNLMMTIRRYSTPIPIHYAWCTVCSAEIAAEAEKRGISEEQYIELLEQDLLK